MTHEQPPGARALDCRQIRLKNRRVQLAWLDSNQWHLQFKRLRQNPDEPRVVRTALRLTPEALGALVAIYFQMAAQRTHQDRREGRMKVNYTHELIERGRCSNNKTARSLAELAASLMHQLDALEHRKAPRKVKALTQHDGAKDA